MAPYGTFDADGGWKPPPRGRPALSARGGVAPRLQVRVPAETAAEVRRLAHGVRMSQARWIRAAIDDAILRQRDAPFVRRPARWALRPLPYQTGRVLVIVLAGGASTRMGGGDKTRRRLGDRSLLDHVLGWLPEETCIVVGEPRPLVGGRSVHWCRERPPGSGPMTAVRAALELAWDLSLRSGARVDDEVLLLAGDAPFAPRATARLRAALAGDRFADVALLVDGEGRRQHLCALWRKGALDAACKPHQLGASMRGLLDGRRVIEVPARGAEARDCDDLRDLAELDAIWRETR